MELSGKGNEKKKKKKKEYLSGPGLKKGAKGRTKIMILGTNL